MHWIKVKEAVEIDNLTKQQKLQLIMNENFHFEATVHAIQGTANQQHLCIYLSIREDQMDYYRLDMLDLTSLDSPLGLLCLWTDFPMPSW